jgi:microsomal dipeptidase-like Zn-dependent dipeptidase
VMKIADTVGIEHVGWSTDYMDSGVPAYFPDFNSFPALCAMFLDKGFSEQDLIKFIGGNALRVHKEVTGS